MHQREELLLALRHLPDDVRAWMRIAIASGRHRIAPFSYANDLTVCPIAASAREAGIWAGDHIPPGHPAWGTPDGPSLEVEDFAAWFDLCCERHGVASTVSLVHQALATPLPVAEAA
jgi:hypothetical protein